MKRDRNTLKGFFNRGDIPTEANFADLIDSMLIQDEDNIGKSPNDPLKITASGVEEALVNFFRRDQATEALTWRINQKPEGKDGLSIGDANFSRLFIENGSGHVGIGTTAPESALHVNVPVLSNQIKALTVDVETFGDEANARASHFFQVRDIGAAPPDGHTFFYIRGDGHVGIGTKTPDSPLTIRATDTSALHINVAASSNAIRAMTIDVDSFGNMNNALASYFLNVRDIGAAPPLGKTHFYIRGDGSVGIGTSNPSKPLTIRATRTSDELIGFEDQSGQLKWHINQNLGGNNPGLNFVEAGVADGRLFIKAGGNVGIGTTTPTRAKLEVAGMVGNTVGLFGAGQQGISLVASWPTVGINSYFNGRWKSISAGWTGTIDVHQGNGSLRLLTGPNATAADQEITLTERLTILNNGDLFIPGDVRVNGTVSAARLVGQKNLYVTDIFINNLGETLEQGDVVVISEDRASQYYILNNDVPVLEIDLTQNAYNARICGIVCELYGEIRPESDTKVASASMRKGTRRKNASHVQGEASGTIHAFTTQELHAHDRIKVEIGQLGSFVTLGAYAFCKVDADIAPINVGDMLTTSPTKGHAQKVLDPHQALGAILGKALGSLKKGKGKIPVLVMLQ